MDWDDFYGNVNEKFPHKILETQVNPVLINLFAEKNHAGNVVTSRYQMGIFINVQNAPIFWHLNKYNMV